MPPAIVVELFEKRKDRAMIIVSHVPEQIKAHCDIIYVLDAGRIQRFDNHDEAYDYYASRNR